MERKKILFIITKSNWGGAQRYLHDLACSLPNEQFEAVVALGGGGERGAGEGELARKLSEKGIRTAFIGSFARDMHLRSDVSAFFEVLRLMRKERPDIVHLNSSKAGGLGALAARFSLVPRIVFTSHGLAYDEDRSAPARALMWLATWMTFLLCHTVIVLSKDNLKRARKLPFCARKIHLVYNGLPLLRFSAQEQARMNIASRAQLSPDALEEVWIGTISELTRNKGVIYLVEAARIIKEEGVPFRLFIIGEGEEKERIKRQIEQANLGARVHLLGFIPDAYEHLSAFDIFALTSVKEGLPYVLMEAGQAGCAIVGTAIPGIQDIVEEGSLGLLARPKQSAEIADKLLHLIKREDECKALGQTAKDQVIERFSLERMVRETIALYRR